jgi:hypothetical protein
MNILRRVASILVPSLALAALPTANAIVVFSDGFETEPNLTILNYNSFDNWTVSNGTVDLLNAGYFGLVTPTITVDLDGSTFDAGIMTSTAQSLIAGNYVLSYQLAGSQRGDGNTVTVSMSGISGANQSHTLPSAQGLTTFTLNFSVGSLVSSSIVFDHAGGDNLGLLLVNVKLERVDPPTGVPDGGATVALLGGGLALLCACRRRQ